MRKEELTQLEILENTSFSTLSSAQVQETINSLNPASSQAIMEAEIVLGIAETGCRLHEGDDDWEEVRARAYSIFRHRNNKSHSNER